MFSETDNAVIFFFIAGTLIVSLLATFLLLYIYLYQQKVNRFRIALQEQELKKQQAIFYALNDGEEKERGRLAEELHDGLGAKLSGMKMSLEYLSAKFMGNDTDAEIIKKLVAGMNESVEELREISRNLQPSFMITKGLKNALKDSVSLLNSKNQTQFSLYFDENISFSDNRIELITFRIVSELLNNILKHADARNASVQIMQRETTFDIVVEDNGKGFINGQKFNGIGIINLKNRIAGLGGKFTIDSSQNGSIIIAEIPLITTL